MESSRKFSPERLYRIRKLRKARRYFKQTPLFAYARMKQEYTDYTYTAFIDDLRRRSRPKKRRGKSLMVKYGRYYRMQQLTDLYRQTGVVDYAMKAMQLKRHLTKPYRLLLSIKGNKTEYSFSPYVPIERIEQLAAAVQGCREIEQIETLISNVRHYGN